MAHETNNNPLPPLPVVQQAVRDHITSVSARHVSPAMPIQGRVTKAELRREADDLRTLANERRENVATLWRHIDVLQHTARMYQDRCTAVTEEIAEHRRVAQNAEAASKTVALDLDTARKDLMAAGDRARREAAGCQRAMEQVKALLDRVDALERALALTLLSRTPQTETTGRQS